MSQIEMAPGVQEKVLEVARENLGKKNNRLSPGIVYYVFVAIGIAFIALVVLGKYSCGVNFSSSDKTIWSFYLVVGALAFSITSCLGIYKYISKNWIFDDKLEQIRAFFNRDRRGCKLLSADLKKTLDAAGDLTEIFRNQPDETLLALIASGMMPEYVDLMYKSLKSRRHNKNFSINTLPAHPACIVLTRIDFAYHGDGTTRREAVAMLPTTLWTHAYKQLLRSKYAEARSFALKRVGFSRAFFLKKCVTDQDQPIRSKAWQRLKKDLTRREVRNLCKSDYADTRLRAIESGLLSRKKLIELCGKDEEQIIREAAWERLNKK